MSYSYRYWKITNTKTNEKIFLIENEQWHSLEGNIEENKNPNGSCFPLQILSVHLIWCCYGAADQSDRIEDCLSIGRRPGNLLFSFFLSFSDSDLFLPSLLFIGYEIDCLFDEFISILRICFLILTWCCSLIGRHPGRAQPFTTCWLETIRWILQHFFFPNL